ncbi:hypothetical protein CAOG_07515 [Capsaspora owczarzaki ATCC 30864]|uniref:Amino acid transporter transmembrane domain-containing protein n=1 Tax=Capsaspora owczarzaki (strain ATCC 30864) TaxID=595528 RepID=A0A0D2X517_CAPO3|nr:hypothetical protein CAOG_07515 [Capsaspora owczarzaki ATCC 30864]KJE97029.1 hypothetical protein CAOG_007515 [Capsaspora owczarzaki ATCC 30864]|eukprot:XP_004343389.1 hypothetical protein CAOG_07515 [Capsaspora owczarzaki ATCC 30864]
MEASDTTRLLGSSSSSSYTHSSNDLTSSLISTSTSNISSTNSSSSNSSSLSHTTRPKKATLLSAYTNLATAAVGVGILSYPYAFDAAGVLMIVLLTLVFIVVNGYTLQVLADFAQRHQAKLTLYSYEELVQVVLGRRAYLVAVAVLFFNVIGSCTGFLIVVCDLAVPVLAKWIDPDSFLASRTFVMLVFGLCVVFPLSLLGDFHSLAFSSFIAVASVLAVAGVVVYRGSSYIADHGSSAFDGDRVFLVQNSFSIVLAVPLCIFALGCHLQVVPLYGEMSPSVQPRFPIVVVGTVTSCGFLYLLTGLFGYVEWTSSVKSDVLTNYDIGDTVIDVAKLLMGLHITLAYPVALFPGRKALDLLIVNWTKGRVEPTLRRTMVQNFFIVLVTGLFAVLVPQVDMVFGFVGSTSAVILDYGFPALMLLQRAREVADEGFFTKPSQPTTNSSGHYPASPVDGRSDGYNEKAALLSGHQGAPRTRGASKLYLFSSAFVVDNESADGQTSWYRDDWYQADGAKARAKWVWRERLIGRALVGMSVLVALVGTGVNLYQDITG